MRRQDGRRLGSARLGIAHAGGAYGFKVVVVGRVGGGLSRDLDLEGRGDAPGGAGDASDSSETQ